MRALSVALLCLLLAPAQATRPGPDYVTVDAVVTDQNNRPVTDLTRADFTITDRSQPQAIDSFQLVAITTAAAPGAAPDVVTNADLTPQSRVFAIVIDDLHLLDAHAAAAKLATLELLRSLAPDDEAAIVFTGRSELGENFTRDRARLTAAADRIIDAVSNGLGAVLGPATLRAARTSALTLKNAAASLAGSSHGRRAIVFISGGSVLNSQASGVEAELKDAQALQQDLDAAYETARRANAPIYTLDPRGAVTPDAAVRTRIASAAERQEIEHRVRIQHDRLTAIANATGGRALINVEAGAAAREVVIDNAHYYVLGFRPAGLVRDGQFHPITVQVNRPGLQVRARRGYVAPEPATTLTPSALLDRALSSGLNVGDLPLRMFTAPISATAKGMASVVSIEVTYPVAAAGKIDDDLHLTIYALDADGAVRATSSRALRFSFTAATAGPVSFLIDDVVDAPAIPLTLRAGVSSRALAVAGTVQASVDVPEPSRGPLTMGGIVLGFTGPPRQPVMSADLIKAFLPLQPTTARVFSTADTLRVFTRFFWGTGGEAVEVTLAVRGSNFPTQGARSAGQVTNGWHIAVLDAGLPLKDLPPGAYTLEITGSLPNGQKVKREVPFTVK